MARVLQWMGSAVKCEYRQHCLVDITKDSVEMQVPRSTWGLPCKWEATGNIIGCPKRTSWKMYNVEKEMKCKHSKSW